MKAQLKEQSKQCIFCKLIKGEMPSKKVFEDDVTISMLDIYPAKKGHIVFMQKEHYPIMPYIPADEFKHLFGLIPQLSTALMSGMVATGVNLFIANGGAAGQQAPHFLFHLMAREAGDGFFNFWLNKRNAKLDQDQIKMLSHNFPLMMANHFKRNPASWHKGAGERPAYITKLIEDSTVVYEDEKAIVAIPAKEVTQGHFEIYSKEEEKDIRKLSIDDSHHLFFVASFAATALFEGLGAQATNIILKSGNSDDNPDGTLSVHILARRQGDDLSYLHWQPKQPSYNLDDIQSKIKDKTWKIKYIDENKKKTDTKPQVLTPTKFEFSKVEEKPKQSPKETNTSGPHEEIRKAIEKAMGK